MTSTATDEVAAGAPTDPAGSPRNLTYTATYTAVTLSWDDPADDSITGYQILRRNRQDAGDHLGVLVDDTGRARQTYTDKDLEPRAEHEYQVNTPTRTWNPGQSTKPGTSTGSVSPVTQSASTYPPTPTPPGRPPSTWETSPVSPPFTAPPDPSTTVVISRTTTSSGSASPELST